MIVLFEFFYFPSQCIAIGKDCYSALSICNKYFIQTAFVINGFLFVNMTTNLRLVFKFLTIVIFILRIPILRTNDGYICMNV